MFSPFYRRCFAIATTAILGWLVLKVLEPLLGALEWAAVLAFLLYPLHDRLTRRLRGRAAVSAGLITTLTPFFVLAPVAVLGVVFAGQVGALIQFLRGRSFLPWPQVVQQMQGWPVLGGVVRWVQQNAPISADQVQTWASDGLQTVLKSAASMGGSVALGVFGTLVGFFMMLFLLFFFLRDGRTMLREGARSVPLEARQRDRLLQYLADVLRAVVYGSTATALIQGLFAGVGFALVGLPSPVVFGVLATIAAFLPSGSSIVLLPAALYLCLGGRWGAGAFLAAWTGVMWIVENVLRPVLTAHRAEVSTVAMFVGAIGGAAQFGILGLLIGPVLLSFSLALLRYAREPDAQA